MDDANLSSVRQEEKSTTQSCVTPLTDLNQSITKSSRHKSWCLKERNWSQVDKKWLEIQDKVVVKVYHNRCQHVLSRERKNSGGLSVANTVRLSR